jgi:transmembrane sensor
MVETAAAERRTVALADGSSITLNGGTKLVLDEDRPRFARLERGEALFQVVHDSSKPFEVETPGGLLRDMGTVFNVVHNNQGLEVAVSEGAVVYNPEREAKNLTPGMALRKSPGAPLWIGRMDGAAIGSWREGRLVYSAAPISKIAADLSRNLGVTVAAANDVGSRSFSGVILLEGAPPEVLERTAALLGLRLSRTSSTWTLATASGEGS